MQAVLWVAGILLTTLLLLVFLRVQLEFKIIVKNGKNFSFMIVRLLKGLLRLRFNLSVMPGSRGLFSIILRKTDSSLEKETNAEQALHLMLHFTKFHGTYKKQLAYFKSKLAFHNFSVITRVGVGDAAGTALITGGFFTVFTIVTQALEYRYGLKRKKMVVIPYFEGSVFDLDLDCIINFKIGYIMITGLKILMKKIKGGEEVVRTSN